MKKFNIEIIIAATPEQLASIGITDSGFRGQKMRAWDFNTMTATGPCAKVYPYYNENDYFEIPMRYIHFFDLTIEEATFIYPDAQDVEIERMPGISTYQHIDKLEQSYMPSGPVKVIYYEIGTGYKLRAILSREAYRYRLMEDFVQELRAIGLDPVCEAEGINLEYGFDDGLQRQVSKLLNKYVGFWRSIAIMVDHDRENRISRNYIKYQLIIGRDLTHEELIKAVERVQKGI